MKKIPLLLLIGILSCLNTFAQKQGQAYIDSMMNQLSKNIEDTNQVKTYNRLSFKYQNMNPDSGLKYAAKGLALAEKIKWEKGIGRLNKAMGMNYLTKSEFPKALEYFFKALKLFEASNNKQDLTNTLSNIGMVYRAQGDNDKALEYYFKAIAINEEMKDKENLSNNLANVAIAYAEKKDLDKSLEYSFKALKICEELKGGKRKMAGIMSNIGNIYQIRNNHSKALDYYFKALALNKEYENMPYMAINYENIGVSYYMIVQDSSKKYLDSLFKGNKKMALEQARLYTDSAITIHKELKNVASLASEYRDLSDIYSLMGDYKNAFDNHVTYKILNDSVFNMEKDKKITEMSMQYEFDKKDALTQEELQQQRLVRNGLIIGFLIVLLFSIVVFRQRNKVRKEKERSEELLLNILPAEVAEELKASGTAKAKEFAQVTVLFTDFKGFTAITEKLSPAELVGEINYCFSAFDNIIQKYRIEKIKTIGDAYMCAGGLPAENVTHPEDVVKAAIEIRDFMLKHQQEQEAKGELPFEIRIGIHTGSVVAGIVGVKKFAYDIWGDTVNTASRMESSGEVGKVNISGDTYALVKDLFDTEYRGKITAKGKGDIDMYFVERKGS